MATKTKSVTGELAALEHTRDALHAEARAARARVNAHEDDARSQRMVPPPAPELDAAYAEARDRFGEADIAVRQFKVRNAKALLDGWLPDRDRAGSQVVAAVHQLRAAVDQYRAAEHETLEVLARLMLSGRDMRSDRRVDGLAAAVEQLGDLDEIAPPFSHTIEPPEGWLPIYHPTENEDGWIT